MLWLSKIFTSRWRNESNSQDKKHLSGCSQIRNMNFLGFESNVVTKSHITILILRRKKVLGGWFFICRGLMPSTSYRWLALDGGCRCRLCSIWQAAPAKGLSCREGCRYIQRIYRSKSNVDISTFQQQISNWVQFQFLKMTKGCWKAVRCSQQGCDDNGKRNTKLVFHTWRQFVLHSDNPTGFDTRPRCSWGRFFQQEPSGNSWIKAYKDFFERKLLMHQKYEEGKFLLNPDLGYLL